MKTCYVSSDSIKESIKYFSSCDIPSGEQLGLFFFFKSIGINDKSYAPFRKVSGIDEETKKEYLANMYMLSGLFNHIDEEGKLRCSLFPFSILPSIPKSKLFNPGTPFKNLLSRTRDTVDNTLIDIYLKKDESDDSGDNFKFPNDYIRIIKERYLKKSGRISLVYFAAWYFRFKGLEIDDGWSIGNVSSLAEKEALTRACVKYLLNELRITEEERYELFYEDETEVINFSEACISGDDLRNLLSFADERPEVDKNRGALDYMNSIDNVEEKKTMELVQPTGKNITANALKEMLFATKQVILYGAPGTSKSHITTEIKDEFYKSEMIQFHANMTYEQFIGGVSVDNDGKLASKAGVFLSFCEMARKDTDASHKYLFVIDEINRANVSKVFGETILTLDREYTADLVREIKLDGVLINKFSIPSNVYLIATMNSADRSIAQIDFAIRRRFAFVKFFPNSELIAAISDCSNMPDIKPNELMDALNRQIFKVLKDENLLLGHAYFIPKWALEAGKIKWDTDVLRILFNYYIIPIIEEYTYGNCKFLYSILGVDLINRIEENNAFIEALKEQFSL